MNDDFALVDFALVAAPPERVVQALGQVHALQVRAAPGGGQDGRREGRAQGLARGHAPGRGGLLSRLLRRGAGRAAPRPLLIQPAGHLPPAPLARLVVDDLGFGAGETPFRVTAPIGMAGLALVEFREIDGELSPVCAALSAELPGVEVFRFRLSGARHPGAETAFHVYSDGRASRRAASISPEGTAPEADWHVVDAGIPHPVEADSLPHARARAWEVMTPARQGAILAGMGVEPDTLFDPAPGRVALDLSPAEGGTPLSSASRLFRVEAVARPSPAPAPPDPEAPAEDAETSEPAAAEPAGPRGAEAPGAAGGPRLEGPAEPPPEPPPEPPSERDRAWEAEVTDILVTAVVHALPEEEQVPWLTALTARLEEGDVAGALSEAHDLIARGDRPHAERAADSRRLDALFGKGAR